MKYKLLLLILILLQIADAQIPFFYEHITPFVGDQVYGEEKVDQLYQLRTQSNGYGAAVAIYDQNFNLIKEQRNSQATDVWVDENGNSYFFKAWDNDTDVPYDFVNFEVQKFSPQLDFLSYSDNQNIIRVSQGNIGRIQPLSNNTLLLFYSNQRVIYDIAIEELTTVVEDVQIEKIVKTDMLTDTSILIQMENDENFLLADLDGIVYDTLALGIFKDWALYQNHFLALQDDKILLYNFNFEPIGSHDLNDAPYNFHFSPNGKLRFSTHYDLYEITDVFAPPTNIWSNSYSPERLLSSFELNNELGLFFEEDLSDIPDPKFAGVTTRKDFALTSDQLPDLRINAIEITPMFRDTEFVGNNQVLYRVDLKVQVEASNLGNETIHSVFEIDDGNCYPFVMRPNYCNQEIVQNFTLPPGGTAQITAISYDWDWTTELDLDFDICVSLYNPNYNYDRDYSNNHSCKEVFISGTDDKNNLNQTLNLAPNPAIFQTTLNFDAIHTEPADLLILDTQQKLVFNKKVQLFTGANSQTINVSNLAGGHYLVIIKGEKSSYLARLLVPE